MQTFESFLAENSLNYTQAMELGALSDVVKNHIKDNYSELYYGGPSNILGKYGKDIPGTSWKKLEKLAKDKSDKDLEIAIANYKDLASKYKVKAFESLSESKDEIIFSVDDDKLDQMLNARFSRQLDYKDDRGDSYYSLPKREFDQFIDLADSSGFDVDYENSEDSVVYVQESVVNEAKEVASTRISARVEALAYADGNIQIKDVKNNEVIDLYDNDGSIVALYYFIQKHSKSNLK